MEYIRNVIDGFKIVKKSSYFLDGSKDITIVYYCNGKHYSETQFRRIPNCKVKRIREKLEDFTSYNARVDNECEAISFITMLYFINDIACGQ